MQVVCFGIRTCDTVRKARALLDTLGVAHTFHDCRVAGISAEQLTRWCARFGWEQVLNRRGTTFRALPEGARQALDQPKAIALMLAHPACIKRPILELDGQPVLLGFVAQDWQNVLAARAPA